ncbi:MAG: hypothetical protein D3923_17215 [Candidatus Electrothrix sp. AR3]|nr:hypothetical protein [Candidatus Electrothrix sp. AR3]
MKKRYICSQITDSIFHLSYNMENGLTTKDAVLEMKSKQAKDHLGSKVKKYEMTTGEKNLQSFESSKATNHDP